MLNIILCGAPGSGKGTQSGYIAEKYGLKIPKSTDEIKVVIIE